LKPTTSKTLALHIAKGSSKMKNQDAQKLTPDEMQELLASYKGPIKKIAIGKRTTRGPSKKPGESGSLQGAWTEAQDRMCWGDQ
jgi:hypothetical protein